MSKFPWLFRRRRIPFWQGVMTEVLIQDGAFLSLVHPAVCESRERTRLRAVCCGWEQFSVTLNTTARYHRYTPRGPLGQRIRESARFAVVQRTVTGAIMIGLGTYLAAGESK